MFFGLPDNCGGTFDLHNRVRSDVMWLAQNHAVIESPEHGITHPTNIRKWHREQPKVSLPESLQDLVCTPVVTAKVDQRTAKKVSKLAQRAGGAGFRPIPRG